MNYKLGTSSSMIDNDSIANTLKKTITIAFLWLLGSVVGHTHTSNQDILTIPKPKPQTSSVSNQRLPDFQNSANILSEQEKQAGRLFFISVQHFSSLNRDFVLQQYIHDLGNLLVDYANIINPHYIFFIVNEPSINAFAGPAGYIGMHSGLILSASSEGEVASVMAHEIAHTKQRHLLRLVENQPNYANPLLVMGLLLAGIATNSPYVIPGLFTLQGKQIEDTLRSLRQFEDEADATGLQILQKSGFSGQYAIKFMNHLFENDFSVDSTEYLRTHPLTRKRIANLQSQVSDQLFYAPPSEFPLIQAHLSYLTKSTTHVPLSDEQKHYLNFFSLIEQNAYQKAQVVWQNLPIQSQEKSLLFNLLYTQLLLESNQIVSAEKQVDLLKRLYPGHLKVLDLQSQLYMKQNKVQLAESTLLHYTDERTYNLYQAGLWRQLEYLYFKQEEKVKLLYAKAKYQYNLGFLRKALEFMDIAIQSAQQENKKISEINKLKSTYNAWHKQLYITANKKVKSAHE